MYSTCCMVVVVENSIEGDLLSKLARRERGREGGVGASWSVSFKEDDELPVQKGIGRRRRRLMLKILLDIDPLSEPEGELVVLVVCSGRKYLESLTLIDPESEEVRERIEGGRDAE